MSSTGSEGRPRGRRIRRMARESRIAALLHNFVLEPVLFVLALFVLPMLFVTAWTASMVLLAVAEKPVTGQRKLLIGFVVLLVPAAVATLLLRSGTEDAEVSS